jgi:hypothetical protein
MSIQVEVRDVYGVTKVYPICDQAKRFAKLLRQATLTHADIQGIKSLGFEIEVIRPEVKL